MCTQKAKDYLAQAREVIEEQRKKVSKPPVQAPPTPRLEEKQTTMKWQITEQ